MDFMEKMIDSDDNNCRMEEYIINSDCPSIGRTLGEMNLGRKTGTRIFAIMKQDGAIVYNPGADYSLEQADVMLTIESPEQLVLLARTLQRHKRRK
jgi:K+/H+ antiporter YhaU regulatory subunit KhtT